MNKIAGLCFVLSIFVFLVSFSGLWWVFCVAVYPRSLPAISYRHRSPSALLLRRHPYRSHRYRTQLNEGSLSLLRNVDINENQKTRHRSSGWKYNGTGSDSSQGNWEVSIIWQDAQQNDQARCQEVTSAWQRRRRRLPFCENSGFQKEDLVVWNRTAAFSSFRKLCCVIDHSENTTNMFPLPLSDSLSITYAYPVVDFGGSKSIILMVTSSLHASWSRRIGLEELLRNQYGNEDFVKSVVLKALNEVGNNGAYIYADILDFKNLQEIVVNQRIDWLVHFSALLSAVGESNTPLAIRLNIEGFHNVPELAKQYRLKLFVPSTIGAFGPISPQNPTQDLTIHRPRTIYGVSKVYADLMGEYYNHKFGLDFRSLRFPGVISADSNPGGGTTDYICHIFHDALKSGHHHCFLRADTRLPMIYVDDCLHSITEVLVVPKSQLKIRTYNVQAMSFTPAELTDEIRKHVPDLKVTYKPDSRQEIADSWPMVFDDTGARTDWGWKHDYDLPQLVSVMLKYLAPKYGKSFPTSEIGTVA